MSVTISGLQQLQREIENRYGQQQMQRISDEALKEASLVYKTFLIAQLESFKDTGATVDELTFTEPYWKDGIRTITVHWKGPKGRYRVIHLNEYGTVNNPNPRGKGAIARSLQAAAMTYRRAIEQALRRSV